MPPSEPMVLIRDFPCLLRRGPLEAFARQLRRQVTGGRGFVCLITDDRELQRLNREFLGKNYPTDVLSFPVAQNLPAGKPASRMLGEMAISFERARDQASAFGHPVGQEIRILMLHGVLHLMGMDHERDQGAMAQAEAAWRKRLGLRNGLIERVGS